MYHVNPETGNPNICRASKGHCPYGGAEVHFDSKQEARAGFEKGQSAFESKRLKELVTSSGKAGEHNIYAGLEPGVLPLPGGQCDLAHFTERDADQLLDWWDRPARTTTVDYSREERRAIIFYQGGGHFRELNGSLREKSELTELGAENLHHLQKALAKATLKEPITLFRGIKAGAYADKLAKLKPGAIITEEAFISTTPSEKGALGFAQGDGLMLQIEAPKGGHAVDLGADVFSIDEDELLLAPQKMRVESVTRELLDGVPVHRVVLRPISELSAR